MGARAGQEVAAGLLGAWFSQGSFVDDGAGYRRDICANHADTAAFATERTSSLARASPASASGAAKCCRALQNAVVRPRGQRRQDS